MQPPHEPEFLLELDDQGFAHSDEATDLPAYTIRMTEEADGGGADADADAHAHAHAHAHADPHAHQGCSHFAISAWFQHGTRHRAPAQDGTARPTLIQGPGLCGGTVQYHRDGHMHREDGPALTNTLARTVEWRRFGELHNPLGPAAIYGDDQFYAHRGALHRPHGLPTIIRAGKGFEWHYYGVRHRSGCIDAEDQPSVRHHGTMAWFRHGLCHRDFDLPAYVEPGLQRWYCRGVLHRAGDRPALVRGTTRAWYKWGALHRDHGPALVTPTVNYWYRHGVLLGSDAYTLPSMASLATPSYVRRHVVLLSGWSGAGKDTLGALLVANHGFTRFAFADSLKQATADRLGLDVALMHTVEGKATPLPDGRTVRQALIDTGTAMRREAPMCFVAKVAADIFASKVPLAVVTDWRLPDEAVGLYSLLQQAASDDADRYLSTPVIYDYCFLKVRVNREGQTCSPVADFATENLLNNFHFDITVNNSGAGVEDLHEYAAQITRSCAGAGHPHDEPCAWPMTPLFGDGIFGTPACKVPASTVLPPTVECP
jgi:hypothetical protein